MNRFRVMNKTQLSLFSAVDSIHIRPKFIDSTQPQQNFEGAFYKIKDSKLINGNIIRFCLLIYLVPYIKLNIHISSLGSIHKWGKILRRGTYVLVGGEVHVIR